ncbi:acylphosphatase [Desmospora profundinema]|uniref:acylphosphatase n=1 Tax=Desmospora profundinema TaxID=1571184 RepID=A0ABU1IIN1_9BACL|nr:acylphosphatase [Desmospora profundinema]MDR6224407.1 acylphosphatase [Desmospora profundinema]
MKRIHLVIHGRVQGVGFRFFVQQMAAEYDVKGWVRNRDDGSVELEAQADENRLSRFTEAVKQGPRFSKVTDWEIREKNPDSSLRSFHVRYE